MAQEDSIVALSRRDFLKTAALAGVGAALASSPVLAAAGQKLASEKREGSTIKQTVEKHQRILGTGAFALQVSAMGFGCMGMNHHRGAHPDKKEMIALLRQVAEMGVTLFDTAETYGPYINEELVGEALLPYKNKVCISTKFGFEHVGGRSVGLNSKPERIRQVAENSLKGLRIDTIDLFYQHRLDPEVPIEDVAGTVKDLIQEGKVRRFGLCEISPQTIRRAHAVQPITAVQSEYSLMWREPEKDVLPVLEELGIGFVPYSPINRGFLGGKLNEYTRFDAHNDNRASLPRFTPEAIRANTALVEVLNIFGRTQGMTSSQVALAWILAKNPSMVPIPGTTKRAHQEENLRALDYKLSAEEVRALEESVSRITIVGERYPPSEQKKVAK